MTSRQHLDTYHELRAPLAERCDQVHHLGRFVIYRLTNTIPA